MSDRRHRPGRDQRGVRRAGHPVLPRPRHRPGPAQRQRRRDRGRPPVRHDRRADHHHADQLAAVPRQAVRPGDHVRRRRPGHGDDHRAAVVAYCARSGSLNRVIAERSRRCPWGNRRTSREHAKGGPGSRTVRLRRSMRAVGPGVAEQAQDLDVEPDQRDHDAERGVPGELLRRARCGCRARSCRSPSPGSSRRCTMQTRLNTTASGRRCAGPRPPGREQVGDQVDEHQAEHADRRADDHAGELGRDPDGADLVDEQHAGRRP